MSELSVLVLISRISEFRLDNYAIIPNALLGAGCDVLIGDIETLAIKEGRVTCACVKLRDASKVGGVFNAELAETAIVDTQDLVWSLASPHPDQYLATFQLLWVLNQRVPFVNDAASLLFMNNKITLAETVPSAHSPVTHVSNSFDALRDIVEAEPGRSWVVKPPNEGCGADVFLLNSGEKNSRAILQSATGNSVANYERYGRQTIGLSRSYAAMQSYVPNVKDNEKRVLIVGGEPICGFRRYHHDSDHRANVTLGNNFDGLTLDDDEMAFCRSFGQRLINYGIFYAGLDLAYPYVLELNLVNPGALNYSYKATGVDQAPEAIDLLLKSLRTHGRIKDLVLA